MTLPARCCALAPADIDPYLPPAPQLQQASRYVAVDRRDDRPTDGRTDGQTDAVPLHRRSPLEAAGVNNKFICQW